jgi:hypothetical protein
MVWVLAGNAWRRGLYSPGVRGACQWQGRPVGAVCQREQGRQGNAPIGWIIQGSGARRGFIVVLATESVYSSQ